MSFKTGVCNLCGTGCGHYLKTEGNAVVSVAPVQSHPVSRGRLCVRGWHVNELLSSDERIDAPLIRENGALHAASWDEALSLVVRRFSSLADPASEAGVLGSARSSNEDCYLLMRLARTVLRTDNISVGADAGHANALEALEAAFGVAGAVGDLTRIDRARYLLVVGTDVTKQNPILGSNLHVAARRGARLVTLCSMRTQIAELSARHVAPRPGTKRVVLDALSKEVLRMRAEGGSIAERALPGYEEFARALEALSPAGVAGATGVAYESILEEARAIAGAESIVILFSSGISGLDRETVRAVANLALATGTMAHPDSALLPAAGICNLVGSFDMGLAAGRGPGFRPLEDAKLRAALGAAWGEELSLRPGRGVFDLLAEGESRLKALFVVDHDDGIVRHRERIAALDFVAYAGAFRNPFMELAHVVLPTAAFAETDGTYTASDRRVQFSSAKAEAPRGVGPGWKLYGEIARAAGKRWTYAGARDVFAEIASVVPGYAGMSHDELAKGFGKHWEIAGGGRARALLPAGSGPAAASTNPDHPFALMIGKAQHFWHQNNLMRKTLIPRREYDATLLLYPEGYIEIGPADAKALQVRDKGLVRVSSAGGSMTVAVKISDAVQDGTASIPYFIKSMIGGFLEKHDDAFTSGEDGIIPIRIEKV
jgi:formate dehydrogenase major subunit